MAEFDADEYRKGGWRTAADKEQTHYQRLGLSANEHVRAERVVLAHRARANWWRQRGAQVQGGKNNPLIAEVAPFIKTAEENLQLALTVLSDVDRKAAYDRQIAEHGAKANEAKLLEFIRFTLRDRILTPTERNDLMGQAHELGILQDRAEKLIQQELNETGSVLGDDPSAAAFARGDATPVVTGAASPRLVLSQTALSLGTLRRGQECVRAFTIDNLGGGVLQGTIDVSHPKWMTVSQPEIDPRRHHQEVTIRIDTASLALGTNHVGMVEVRSNGGRQGVRIDFSIELEKSAVSRYRTRLFWGGLLAGGLLGLLLYALASNVLIANAVTKVAGLVGFIAFIVVCAAAGGWGGGIGGFLLAGITQQILVHVSMRAYSAGAWAAIISAFLYFWARRLLVANLSGDRRMRAWAALSGVGLVAIVILGGLGFSTAVGLSIRPNLSAPLPVEDRLAGSSIGHPSGIQWAHALGGRGAIFSAANSSRIEYPGLIPPEGTLELWIKVDGGYGYNNFQLRTNQDAAMIFSSDAQGGDVVWPGTTKFFVSRAGSLVYWMATSKYDKPHALPTEARKTKFRFGEWHAVGVSYGRQGEYIMLDGKVVASSPGRTQTFGQAGNHQEPLDLPTIGETVSHFWPHHRFEGGFDGLLAAFRVSAKQKDWQLAQGIKADITPSAIDVTENRSTDGGSHQWTELKLGDRKGDFSLDTDHHMYYRNIALRGFVIPAESDGAWVSPVSPNRDVLCFSLTKNAQGFLIYLPKLTGAMVLDGARFAFGLSAVQWMSWSPDGAFGLAAHYSEAHPELFVIGTREQAARRVPGISLAKEGEEQVFDLDSVQWESAEQFRMRVTINCNPYTVPDTCSDDTRKKVLRKYDLLVNARSLDVSSTVQSVGLSSTPGASDSNVPVTPSFDCSKARTPTEKLICREPELASMEREMVSAYKQVIDQASSEQKAIVSREHLQWFSQYTRACDAVRSETERKDCVARFLRNRTQELTAMPKSVAPRTEPRPSASGTGSLLSRLDPSERLLRRDELEGLTKWDLEILKNLPYARHGYSFRRRELKDYFSEQRWYRATVPAAQFLPSVLTPVERQNITLISQFQKDRGLE